MTNTLMNDGKWDKFSRYTDKQKLDSMYNYLVNNLSMPEVEELVFNREKSAFNVSNIHRAYNFRGENHGKYAPTSEFCLTYGEVYRKDIEAFITKYRNGVRETDSLGSGIELENFLIERLRKRNQGFQRVQNTPPQQYYNNNRYNSAYEENNFYNDRNYQNVRNNSNNNFEVSQYNGNQYNSSQNDRFDTENSDFSSRRNTAPIDVDALGPVFGFGIIIFVVLSLIFNWFNWRSKLLVLISDWIQVVWFVGMLIFLLRIIIGKVEFMYGKNSQLKYLDF